MDSRTKPNSGGLLLNHGKCEVIGLNPTNQQEWSAAGLKVTECPPEDAILLGTPIQAGKVVDKALEEKRHDLSSMIGRLALLPVHTALFLLQNVFAIPKLLYILRTAPCCDSAELLACDEMIRTSLASILNTDLSTFAEMGSPKCASAGTDCLLGFRCWCHWTPFPSPERHHLTARSSCDEIGGSMEICGGRGQCGCGGDEDSASMG